MRIAEECSILDEVEFEELLSFLNEMVAILWINGEGLRDVIILDPIEFFIKPASMLIVLNDDVKRRKKLFDEIQLPKDIKKLQKEYKKFDKDWWELMTEKGILEHRLLEHILESIVKSNARKNGPCVETKVMISSVIKLMTTFGILVPLSLRSECSQQYVLPIMLPKYDQSIASVRDPVQTCYFAFAMSSANIPVDSILSIPANRIQSKGFLPHGLFERLICKVLEWCQQYTSSGKLALSQLQ